MELWNNRILKAPPTYTYPATRNEVDIDHLEAILQEGVKFYKEQYLLNLEGALLARIIYRMKRKFRNSKDFQTLEKVKKDLMIYLQMDIIKKLELLLSSMPKHMFEGKIFLPTKNMLDFILVRLQGVGKILCRVVQMCKLTAWYYERRLHLGHFWRLALVAIGLISRINILSLNIIKFTCLLYIRLLPFSHKLKNSGTDWLPKDYIFPKDLKAWLNIEWSKLEEVIEIPDKDFNLALIDLVEDSDDDVQFCKEYIELDEDEDLEIITEFKKINKRIKPIEYDNSLTVLRGFSSNLIDPGEMISPDEKDEEEIQANSNKKWSYTSNTQQNAEVYVDNKHISVVEGIDIGELILSSDEMADIISSTKTITDSGNNGQDQFHNKAMLASDKHTLEEIEDNVLISSSDEELVDISSNDSVEFVEEDTSSSIRQKMITSDFISLSTENDGFLIQDNKNFPKGISNKFCCGQNSRIRMPSALKKCQNNKNTEEQHSSILEITDTPKMYIGSRINKPLLDNNEIIEISGNTSVDYTNSSGKRKGTWDKCKIRKKPRWSSTLDIVDANVEIPKSIKFLKNNKIPINPNLFGLSGNSNEDMSGIDNLKCQSGNESTDVTEHSFGTLIYSTSTPAKKKQKKKKIKIKKSSIQSEGSTFEIKNTSQKKKKKKISNSKQRNKTQNKRFNKNNKSNIVDSNIQNKIVKTGLNSSSNNISCSSGHFSRSSMNDSNKKHRLKKKKWLKVEKNVS